jgi:hypothetical protein
MATVKKKALYVNNRRGYHVAMWRGVNCHSSDVDGFSN